MNTIIRFLRLNPDRDADIPLPRYMTTYASGMDIFAAIEHDLSLAPGEIACVPTGFAMSVPHGFEAQIRPRSGLSVKHGIGIINSPGTIDSDYRGEVMIPLINFGKTPFVLRRKDRIAQMVISRVYQFPIELADHLDETERNTGGFGHTGVGYAEL